MNWLKEIKQLHFVGSEGAAMKPLANLMTAGGYVVTGSDLMTTGHARANVCPDKKCPDMVIYSAAITQQSAGFLELEQARQLGIPVKSRAFLIGRLMDLSQVFGIAVAGAHGKTTTTGMVEAILSQAGQAVATLSGAQAIGQPHEARLGRFWIESKKRFLLVEACEWQKQMLDLRPKAAIITNIDQEHLDTYPKGLKQIRRALADFVKLIPSNGLLVLNGDDLNCRLVAKSARSKVKFVSRKDDWPGLRLQLAGDYNRHNALLAARLCHELGLEARTITRALNNFQGMIRRQQLLGEYHGASVVDDYGHHPTEIKLTLEGLRSKMGTTKSQSQISNSKPEQVNPRENKLILVFQAHQHTRTKALADQFKTAFSQADQLVVLPIYEVTGRDDPSAISSRAFFELIEHPAKILAQDYDQALEIVKKLVQSGDLVVTMGATPVEGVAKRLVEKADH